ncbi:MAG: nuclear transport factor 2 family protein [Acidimicrobiaceae bacterium]|nr:nuclear transport factor 2 family protein [Acidimicrobiaceae bacterium]
MQHDAVQRLLDIEEIKQLKARYFRCLDTKDWEGFRGVFVEDLQFVFAERNLTLERDDLSTAPTEEGLLHEGRESFVAWTRETAGPLTTVHRGYMPEIVLTGPDTASGIWAMTDYLQWPDTDPPVGFRGYGHYQEEYVRTAEGWRLKRSVLSRLRVDPLEGGLPSVYEESAAVD